MEDVKQILKPVATVLREARDFIQQYYRENDKADWSSRWAEVEQQILASGTYVHTYEELAYGAKLAWRNSNRCIGRLFWKTLKVLDCREVDSEAGFIDSLHQHLRVADHGHKIRSVISIFPPLSGNSAHPVFRIKNYTLLMYAGHTVGEQILGDPAHRAFTQYCKSLGWEGAGTAFDLLPIVYRMDDGPDRYHQLPPDLVTEIPITHPEHEWFAELGLRWYKLPVISSMQLDIGGIIYPACPFNGWYMLDEVATRNFGDQQRYNILPVLAERLALDTSSPFWKERALLVLNEAVYHSYQQADARIVDHHTAVEQFMLFTEQERAQGREVTGDWSWLIPPTASSTTGIFHRELPNTTKLPNYLPANCPADWATDQQETPPASAAAHPKCPFAQKSRGRN